MFSSMLPTPPLTPATDGKSGRAGAGGWGAPPSPFLRPPTSPQPRPATGVRNLSDSEISYFLPSRADGVDDMYVHHGLRADPSVLSPTRLRLAWAIQLARHPLLASRVEIRSYSDVLFVHTAPGTVARALADADARLTFVPAGDEDIVDIYLNGPRTLTRERLACLVVRAGTRRTVGQTGDAGPSGDDLRPQLVDYEVMLCAAHFISDEIALHTFMSELYTLIGGNDDLEALLQREVDHARGIPRSLEERLALPPLAAAAGRVVQRRADKRLVGRQVFPTLKGREQNTVVPTRVYNPESTRRALARCKENGVTIENAVFVLCAMAWARQAPDLTEPTIISSALDMRTHIPPSGSFFHLAAGHLNVVLPSLLPPMPLPRLFWHRARSARSQASAAAKSRLSRAQFLGSARDRVARAQHWARVDDEEVANPGLGLGIRVPERELPQPLGSPPQGPPPAPQGTPLLEASVLGDLDGMYRHDAYPGIRMFSLTAGSRQRPGGLLLSAYTLRGKLVLSLGYDRNGFQDGVVERWWGDVLELVDEVLLA